MKKKNPFEKFLGPEDHLHHQVITWLQYQYPRLKFHHSPLEGKRTPFERFKFDYLGTDEGFPDLLIPGRLLAIELKIKPNKPTNAQLEWLAYFKKLGWTAEVCYTFEEVTKLFK